jgi:hypothetical protein
MCLGSRSDDLDNVALSNDKSLEAATAPWKVGGSMVSRQSHDFAKKKKLASPVSATQNTPEVRVCSPFSNNETKTLKMSLFDYFMQEQPSYEAVGLYRSRMYRSYKELLHFKPVDIQSPLAVIEPLFRPHFSTRLGSNSLYISPDKYHSSSKCLPYTPVSPFDSHFLLTNHDTPQSLMPRFAYALVAILHLIAALVTKAAAFSFTAPADIRRERYTRTVLDMLP